MFRTFILATTALAALPAFAGEVNVYSYRQPELIEPLIAGFQQATGNTANVVYIDNGITERLVAEGPRSPADLIFTVDVARLEEAREAGVTQPVQSEILNANIPAEMRDPDGNWFGLTTRARIVYASKERVGEGEVTTYEDLADPKWAGRICTRSGTHAYNIALLSAIIEHDGIEAATDWAEGVKANLARPPEGGDRDQVKAIWAGECDIALGNTYYMGAMLADPEQQDWANAVRLDFPTFADGSGTHVNISGVAMVKGASNEAEALAFMEYLSSPEAQQIYAEVVNEYPVTPGTPPSDLVASWGELTPDTTSLTAVASNRAEALKIMQSIDFDN
ncbi:MAG: Fe(3+) ABC transporter substrate-binding protein [Jannaschia helgolandensis]|mgnify:CR=1 FL=1|jgi:iron(III) transport system substrate-binding protein|uniref:Iron(III) transport system substrate-binding protein n=1 Tax=Jannaschia helgolandensis TaxID=188906 RepID=A0A1H7KW87_9RHOB|nr:Fe(3+) ABC transporter substrate-binding protein [Jannaschia helgolandensis]SEK91028.1 iron(III) transport system substrate-binding protein [Jannaschia helgolandensis]|tara:strand:+ start:3353 stop:4357 length:1005 start_codon:yes stop_codon:yes gene_type:complete